MTPDNDSANQPMSSPCDGKSKRNGPQMMCGIDLVPRNLVILQRQPGIRWLPLGVVVRARLP